MSEFTQLSFVDRLESLLSFDCVRISRLLETIEYGSLYAIITFFVGAFLDAAFQNLYPGEKKCEPLKNAGEFWRTFTIVMMQGIVAALLVIYIRKTAQLMPFIFDVCPKGKYAAHEHVKEYEGEILIGIIFVGVQANMVRQLVRVRNYIVPQGSQFDEGKCD